MPPAFVLSQDQTLMFNPNLSPAQGTDPIRASITLTLPMLPAISLTAHNQTAPVPAQAYDDPRRRPRIPSISQQCQSTKPRTAGAQKRGSAARGGGLISPSLGTVNRFCEPAFGGPKPQSSCLFGG